jgi:threonine/homoserine/homoserine lactone efflux protein
VLAILGGWVGALVLGWLAWEFWTHSSLPKVAA